MLFYTPCVMCLSVTWWPVVSTKTEARISLNIKNISNWMWWSYCAQQHYFFKIFSTFLMTTPLNSLSFSILSFLKQWLLQNQTSFSALLVSVLSQREECHLMICRWVQVTAGIFWFQVFASSTAGRVNRHPGVDSHFYVWLYFQTQLWSCLK